MKVIITGHTNGIGLALANELASRGHEIIGFSLANKNDISDPLIRDKILLHLNDADVFINNVYYPKVQTELLERALAFWEGRQKLIVNLGSKSIYADVIPLAMKDYVADKKQQNTLIENRKLKATPQVMNLILGLVDTSMSKALDGKKLNPADLAKFVCDAIELKDQMYIQNLTVDVPYQNWTDIRHKSL